MKDKVVIIAEAGVNHNGNFDLALRLCDAAKEAGADIVKFQTFNTEINVLKDCQMPEYQQDNVGTSQSHWEMVKNLELSEEAFVKIKKYCERIGIKFLSTPSERKSLDFLIKLGLDTYKLSSGEITNLPFIRAIGKLRKKVILSTGMADMAEIKAALEILTAAGTRLADITVLHCNTEYPTPMKDVNLLAMLTIKKELGVRVGYSDHTLGTEVSVAAVSLGAEIIEKHFTLDRSMPGPDHKASLEPDELKLLVRSIRNIESALGSGIKKPTASESKYKVITRKCIVAAIPVKAGEIFTESNITVKRPERGVSAMQWDNIIGKKSPRDFLKDEPIQL